MVSVESDKPDSSRELRNEAINSKELLEWDVIDVVSLVSMDSGKDTVWVSEEWPLSVPTLRSVKNVLSSSLLLPAVKFPESDALCPG